MNKIEQHKLPINSKDYMRIGSYSDGLQGIHYIVEENNLFRVAISGYVTDDERSYSIVRSIIYQGQVDAEAIEEKVLGSIFDPITKRVFGSKSQTNRKMRKLTK